MSYIAKIIDVWQRDGVLALFRKITKEIELKTLPYFDYWFDLMHGVDTCAARFHDNTSDIGSDDKKTAIRYEATPVNAVRSILKKLPVNHPHYTFIDYGSGKGRVLLMASEYPFKSVIGVELSKRLHLTAENNLRSCRYFNQRCARVKSLCADAAEFKLPSYPLVVFFFTPFLGAVMDRVIGNIQESLKVNPRPIHIVYYGSRLDILGKLSNMNFTHQEIYSRHPLSASGDYRGHLFSSRVVSTENNEATKREGQC